MSIGPNLSFSLQPVFLSVPAAPTTLPHFVGPLGDRHSWQGSHPGPKSHRKATFSSLKTPQRNSKKLSTPASSAASCVLAIQRLFRL
jgi:hypothetical protein